MRHTAAFLAILSALACHHADPRASQALGTDVADEPMVACMLRSLTDSPNIAKAGFRKDAPRTVYVSFVNPPDPSIGGMALVVVPTRGTPKQFVVEYSLWAGTSNRPGVPNLARLNAPAVEATGAQLLRTVRSQCAPSAGGEPACTMSSFQNRITGRCSLGI
jgi:hypothetical protein